LSEASVQTALQTLIQGMSEYGDSSVTIDDWSILDNLGEAAAPFVIIGTSDTFVARKDTVSENTRWDIPVTIFEVFTGWPETLANLRTRRQAIIDLLNTDGTQRSVGTSGVTIDVVRNDGLIEGYYDPYLSPEDASQALPIYLRQRLILEVEEF